VKRPIPQRLRPFAEVKGASQQNDHKLRVIVICNVDQAPPRPVTQDGCGDDHLKRAGFCRRASHRHTYCSFRVESESSSLTIRIRASSGTLSFKLVERLVLSVAVRVCLLRPMALRLSFVPHSRASPALPPPSSRHGSASAAARAPSLSV